MIKLSIIVPIYNVEAYLAKCIDSLLDQSLQKDEYEIILVDDGSTDRSGNIADEYAQSNSNITVIHQENGGLSCARNSGIEHAHGDYVQFVDSDDYLVPDVLPTLLQQAYNENLDVLRFNYQNVDANGNVIDPNKESKKYVDYSDNVCSGEEFLVNRLGSACYACQFLVKRSILLNCKFKSGIFFEDTEWTPRMLLKAERASSTKAICYNYLIRSGSITKATEVFKKKKIIADQLFIIDSYLNQLPQIANPIWHKRMISGMVLGILSHVATDFYEERKYFISKLKELSVFPLETSRSTKSGYRKKMLINFSPLLFCIIIRNTRKAN